MPRIFEIMDKTGRKIHLTDERLNHIKKHPEFSGQNILSIIEQTIKNPVKVTEYPLDPQIRYYYSYNKNRASKAKYLRVIIKYLNGEGFVITAFFVVDV